jgi:hypothetical protein
MNNVQNCNRYINVTSLQACKDYGSLECSAQAERWVLILCLFEDNDKLTGSVTGNIFIS